MVLRFETLARVAFSAAVSCALGALLVTAAVPVMPII